MDNLCCGSTYIHLGEDLLNPFFHPGVHVCLEFLNDLQLKLGLQTSIPLFLGDFSFPILGAVLGQAMLPGHINANSPSPARMFFGSERLREDVIFASLRRGLDLALRSLFGNQP